MITRASRYLKHQRPIANTITYQNVTSIRQCHKIQYMTLSLLNHNSSHQFDNHNIQCKCLSCIRRYDISNITKFNHQFDTFFNQHPNNVALTSVTNYQFSIYHDKGRTDRS